MRVAVASGKGGTGKTIVSTSLAWLFAEQHRPVRYVDTDVEEPNGHLLLRPTITRERRHAVAVPALRDETCSGCGACQRFCEYHAILALPHRVLVLPELCHSCGGCELVCPERALVESPRPIGTIASGTVASGTVAGEPPMGFHSATLDVGQARATPLISALLEEVPRDEHLVILDAPPGTSCSAMAVVSDADRVLLVTEPTPFGLHDLELAVAMTRALGRPMRGLINRSDLGNDEVRRYFERERIPIIAEIPFSREVASAYAEGRIAARESAQLRELLATAAAKLAAEVTP